MSDLLKKTVDLAGAYVARNDLAPQDVSSLITDIFGALQNISGKGESAELVAEIAPPPPRKGPPLGRPRKIRDIAHLDSPVNMAAEIVMPVMSLEDAVTDDVVYCLICGKGCRALKGHLDRVHGLNLDGYRAKFGLEKEFPLVAPAYSEKRRQLALNSGLGDRSRRTTGQDD